MKNKLLFIASFLVSLTMHSQVTYKLYDNFSYATTTYELNVNFGTDNTSYTLQILKNANTHAESVKLVSQYDEALFLSTLSDLMTKILNTPAPAAPVTFTPTPDLTAKWKVTYDRLMKEINKKDVITELYDNQQIEYSGKLRLKKSVTLSRMEVDGDAQKQRTAIKDAIRLEKNKLTAAEMEAEIDKRLTALLDKNKATNKTFIPDYASVRFYNNRINTLSVVGKVDGKEYTIRNSKFSIPFRFVNNNAKGSYLHVYIDGVPYTLNWDDLLDYNPEDTEFNFTVKNKNYKLLPDEDKKIESRNLFDYFTGIIFSDFLGLNNADNSLLMAEGRAIIPLALVNKNQHNVINYFEGFLTTSLYNGQEEGTNFVTWKDEAANNGEVDKVVLFDFFKKRNIETGLNFGIYNFEWKGISTNIIFDYGVQFYRSKLRYVKDTLNNTEDFQVYCIGHGPKVKFEIRPQVNFGADLNIGFLGFNFNGMNTSGETRNKLKGIIEDKPTFLNSFYIVSNFYTKLNDKESNSGLYFRLAAYYDFDTSDIAPQIMVGYATNLTSFINKFKKKNEVTTP